MAQCDANDLIAQACESGFTCRNEPELLALLNQLLCNYAASGGGGGGALTPYTKTEVLSPALPYSLVATRRTHVDTNYGLASLGIGAAAALTFSRTGFADFNVSLNNTSGDVELNGTTHFDLSPGDALLVADASTGGTASVLAVTILEE